MSDDEGAAEKSLFGDARDNFMQYISRRSIKFDVRRVTTEEGESQSTLFVDFPNGREVRTVHINAQMADYFLATGLGDIVFLGDYIAYGDRTSGVIEAQIRSAARGTSTNDLRLLPGVVLADNEVLSTASDADGETGGEDPIEDDVDETDAPVEDQKIGSHNWRLDIISGNSSMGIELSPVSRKFAVLTRSRLNRFRPDVSMKIKGLTLDRHDDLLDLLERYSRALFFEIDLKFNMSLTLTKQVKLRAGGAAFRRRNMSDAPMVMPRNKYAKPAVDLYFYARSATGMPLLQYLAYYQAIEFFFPSFFHSEVIRKLRQELRDPRFNVDDDGELQRLLSIASTSGKGGISERQQLRATLTACVDDDSVESFIRSGPTVKRLFDEKKVIDDAPDLNVKSNSPLVEQVAERVYAIRCRIVHTKEDGGVGGAKVMLPFGNEAGNLGADIALIRFLAQKVIIAGSRGSL
ncbi:hypothetical protein [Saccharothrix stipae]